MEEKFELKGSKDLILRKLEDYTYYSKQIQKLSSSSGGS